MGTVRNLNPSKDTEEFCDFLYGAESGYVYVPTKDFDTGRWDTYFFEWPRSKQDIIDHVNLMSKTREVYIGPAIYSEPNITDSGDTDLSYVKGSNVIWAEFDGALPTAKEFKGAPQPTMRIRSSVPGREHWYWKLEQFSTDLKFIQDTNRALAYALGADLSGWDLGQVLRPLGSLNHKQGGVPVTLVSQSLTEAHRGSFNKVPPVEQHYSIEEFNSDRIPKAERVLLTYVFDKTESNLILQPKMIEGVRSSVLTKVGYICAEKGMDNSEIYAILQWVDSRWGKFRDRHNKAQCYVSLIDFVRQKYPYSSIIPVEEEEADPELVLPVLGMMSHVEQKDDVKWIIDGVLHDSSVVYFVGESESYKTMTAVEFGVNLALGTNMLDWKINRGEDQSARFKMLMLSLEMSGPEINTRFNPILNRYPVEVQKILEENFLTYSDPEGLKLYDPVDAEKIRNTIRKYKPAGIIIDSAQMSFSENMSDEQFVKKSVSTLQRIRHELGVFVFVIHHPRKDPSGTGPKRKLGLSDLFGSQVLQNSASTVIKLEKVRDKTDAGLAQVKLSYLKMRFMGENRPADMTVEINPDLTFKRAVLGTLPVEAGEDFAMAKEAREIKPKFKSGGNGPNGNLDI